MRVMLATDGSPAAAIAAAFVADRTWPRETTIDVVAVLDVVALLPAPFSPSPANVQSFEDSLEAELNAVVEATAEQLRKRALDVTTTILTGKPVDRLVQHAGATGADLVVCGSRGQGELAVLVLGSVSAGLADRAPCPVLVARRRSLGQVLLAHDGTGPAIAAEELVATWPMFDGQPVEVLSVAHLPSAWRVALGHLTSAADRERPDAGIGAARERATQVQTRVTAHLNDAGRHATGAAWEGDPPHAILAEADACAADLIVIGTHGRHGWDRLMLGSVARAVLLHAHASVLVVRQTRPHADTAAAAA
jgi:nucleotide-binding universal stress UspA family protein